ncbi:hypothetical protein ASD21_10855 [Caulobacter sp. Root1455]|uniref:transglutaminase-like domain-containing protein n=1 Tax=unclassified Caulobacter TaxID=2648921 RepID=UPI0006FDC492|nr:MULTISPECIES: transglutaminase-like domain-containing protein [unclassified Caulobacter]KQY35285.1 hypothetical protein ASD38_01580 [Caulobacter sp. Root487D2Y]KQY93261.1 hypothetical protein ASD21_10855 [Caulobacter sp. Root1455]
MQQPASPSETLDGIAFDAPAGAGRVVFQGLKAITGVTSQRYRVQLPRGVERRVQLRFDAEGPQGASYDWTIVSDWSTEPRIDIDLAAAGTYSLHLDLRAGEEISAHFVAQATAIDIGRFGQLCNQTAARVRRRHIVDPACNWSPTDIKALGSIQALADAIKDTYPARSTALRAATGLDSERVLLAVHAMNVVSGLYIFGHQDSNRSGCVLNESEGPIVKPRDYLASRIGCCLDFSCILAAVLDALGVENRAVSIKRDHVFNEITVEGRTFTLDPSINTLYTRAYAEALVEPVEVFAWPVLSLASEQAHRAPLDALIAFLAIAIDLYGPSDLLHHDPKAVFAENYRILRP